MQHHLAKCLQYDGATETALVRTTEEIYLVVKGPVVIGEPLHVLRESDSNYQSACLAFDAICERRRKGKAA